MKLLLQKHYVFDMDHGIVAKALTWGSAKRKARKYMDNGAGGEVVIVTKRKERR